jgi:hypothetical protein
MRTEYLNPLSRPKSTGTSSIQTDRVVRRVRIAFVPASVLTLIVSGGFFADLPWATTLWPWSASPLSYAFIASILAAIAVPLLWVALAGELAAIRAGALDLVVMYGGMAIYTATLLGDRGQPRLWPYVVVFGLACALSAAAFLATRRIPWIDPRPMPRPVRFSFAVFVVVLVGVATALAFHANIFPWPLGPETSVMFGFAYFGAAVYFTCGFLEPRWNNAAGQLAGFLVYDLLLLAPFFDHFKAVHGGQLTSLLIYVALLLYSGGLATYYLFLAPQTRMRLMASA